MAKWYECISRYGFLKAVSNTIRCPCLKCINMAYKECKEVTLDLLKFGMAQSYTEWTFHGEGEEGVNEPLDNSEGEDNEEDQERFYDASA